MKWLDTCLDCGVAESVFWDSTIAEMNRFINSYQRRKMTEQREKAMFDYLQADLIAKSMARLFSKSAEYPAIYEEYPTLFDYLQEEQQQRRNELSIARFKEFSQAFNSNFKKKEEETHDE